MSVLRRKVSKMVAPWIKRRRINVEVKTALKTAPAPTPVVEPVPAPVVEEAVEEVVEVEEAVEEVVEAEEAEPVQDLGLLRKWELVELAEAAGHDVTGLTKRELVGLLS